jgi:hypothetical protein
MNRLIGYAAVLMASALVTTALANEVGEIVVELLQTAIDSFPR